MNLSIQLGAKERCDDKDVAWRMDLHIKIYVDRLFPHLWLNPARQKIPRDRIH